MKFKIIGTKSFRFTCKKSNMTEINKKEFTNIKPSEAPVEMLVEFDYNAVGPDLFIINQVKKEDI